MLRRATDCSNDLTWSSKRYPSRHSTLTASPILRFPSLRTVLGLKFVWSSEKGGHVLAVHCGTGVKRHPVEHVLIVLRERGQKCQRSSQQRQHAWKR